MVYIVLILVLCVVWWYYNDRKRYSDYPPGPLRHPLVGSVFEIAAASKIPSLALHKLSIKYGDVMFVRMGMIDFVITGSYSATLELFKNPHTQSVADIKYLEFRNGRENLGIFVANGEVWQTLRRFTIRTLRDFGFGKSSMDVVIEEEANKLIEYINSQSTPILNNVERIFDVPVFNVIWRLVTGTGFQFDDPRIKDLIRLSNEYVKSVRLEDITLAYPFLFDWFPNWSGKNTQIHAIQKILEFLKGLVNEYEVKQNQNPECFIECFLAQIGQPHFTHKQLLYILLDLFQAGADTTSNSISFVILYMIAFPEVQKKCQVELDSKDTNDKYQLPYTQATILECMRYSSVVSIPGFRVCTNDTVLKGFKLKKGTVITANIHGAHFDKTLWGDPENFRPERFQTNGKIDKAIANQVILFAAGKRVCVGQPLAEATMFTFVTNILRHFSLQAENDAKCNLEPKLGIVYTPYPFNCRFVPRKRQV